jgi:hypothetical protein
VRASQRDEARWPREVQRGGRTALEARPDSIGLKSGEYGK